VIWGGVELVVELLYLQMIVVRTVLMLQTAYQEELVSITNVIVTLVGAVNVVILKLVNLFVQLEDVFMEIVLEEFQEYASVKKAGLGHAVMSLMEMAVEFVLKVVIIMENVLRILVYVNQVGQVSAVELLQLVEFVL